MAGSLRSAGRVPASPSVRVGYPASGARGLPGERSERPSRERSERPSRRAERAGLSIHNSPMSRTLFVILLAALAASACGGDSSSSSTPTSPSQPSAPYSQTDLRVGTGTEATNGRTLAVNYTVGCTTRRGLTARASSSDEQWAAARSRFVLGSQPGDPRLEPGRARHARRRPPPARASAVAGVRRHRERAHPAKRDHRLRDRAAVRCSRCQVRVVRQPGC